MRSAISRFLLGTWILRASNDKLLDDRFTSLILKDDDTLILNTISRKAFFAERKTVRASVQVTAVSESSAQLEVTYHTYAVAPHSVFGVETPDIRTKGRSFKLKKKFEAVLVDQALLVSDSRTPLYYLFDLEVGRPTKTPFVEVSLATFLFGQIIGILINSVFMEMVKDLHPFLI
jgi:hypothetical protein